MIIYFPNYGYSSITIIIIISENSIDNTIIVIILF